jgi:aryl-alcohol dehydrogenase-like predicted oxidoreductase
VEYRQFGTTDLRVSVIGFGAWAIGGNAKVGNVPIGWGPADDDTSCKAIFAAIDAGINFFDTADFYGLGHSEEIIGRTIGNNKEVVIATKVGQRMAGEAIIADYSKQYIKQACEKSLLRLKRDHIDYYQLHNARMHHLQQGECIEAMEELKAEGKARYWGLSLNTFDPAPEAEFLMQHKYADGFQLVLNIINQRAVPLIAKAAANGYGVIARMPLQFGLLTGKFNEETTFSSDDHRSFRLTPDILRNAMDTLHETLDPVCETEHCSWTELALSFIAAVKGVGTIIPGIRTAEHAEKNSKAIRPLSEATMHQLFSLSAEMEVLVKEMQLKG